MLEAIKMDVFPLAPELRSELEYQYRICDDVDWRLRMQMVLLYDDGRSAPEIAGIVKVCEDTVLRAVARYRLGGIEALKNKKRETPPIPKGYLPEDEDFLVQTVRQSPRSLGLDFSNWTLPTLAQYVSEKTGRHMGRHAVADILHARKINMRRPKLKVTSPDPDYAEKRGL
jgi:transposase